MTSYAQRTTDEDAFHKRIHDNHMWGLWELASAMTPHPMPEAIPYMWKWSLLDSICKESGTEIGRAHV